MARTVIRLLTAAAVLLGGACVRTYRGGDPFAGSAARSGPPGRASVLVSFEGACDVCSITLNVAGQRQRFVDSINISRRYRVRPGAGRLTMSAAPMPDRDPVRWIAIRADGELLAEARSDDPGTLSSIPGSGALSISAEVPAD